MEILKISTDHRKRVRLSDGREVTLSPLNKAQTRKIFLDSGQEIGIIQKLYISQAQQIVYVVTERLENDGLKVYLEFVSDPDEIRDEDKEENYIELLSRHQWLLEEENGEDVLTKLFALSDRPDAINDLLTTIGSKKPSERNRRLNVVKKFLILIEKPELRSKPQNQKFWLETCLPLMGHLHINL